MGKRNNFKPSDVFMKAYTRTLENAANSKYGKSDFQCESQYPSKFFLNCEDCPFECSNPYSDDEGGVLDRTFEQWQEWFYDLTGVKDDRPKEMFMKKNERIKESAEHTEQEAKTNKTNEDNIKELEAKAKVKYEIEYLTLDSDEPQTKYVRKVVDLLAHIQQWYQEAIKWNLIANGNISKIQTDFKDIYIKVYDPEEGVILFQDEYTLKSKGLKLAWTRDD